MVGIIILFAGLIFVKHKDEQLGALVIRTNEALFFVGEHRLINIRQVTFNGENAEAYFSSDGKKFVFQAHDGKNSCDQIYIMEIESGKTGLVSTGSGVTTC